MPHTNLISTTSFQTGMSAGVSASLTALVDATARYASENRLSLTKVISGGHYVIQVSRTGDRIEDYMNASAKDLLATYEFDANGRLLNEATWAPPATEQPAIHNRIVGLLKYAFKHEGQFPWLKSDVLISVHTRAEKFGIYVGPIVPAPAPMS